MSAQQIWGVVLAAGAGSRFGGPKALATDADRIPWLHRVSTALREGGCQRVLVALGAAADDARGMLLPGDEALIVADWALGLSATVRAALQAVAASLAEAAVLAPVDTPAMPAAAVSQVIASPREHQLPLRAALAQAYYAGRPGHPVLIGAEWLTTIAGELHGDRGAGAALAAHGAQRVECGQLWDGRDVDRRA